MNTIVSSQKNLAVAKDHLYTSFPLFFYTLQQCPIKYSNELNTAGVLINHDLKLEMWINPEFFLSLSTFQRVGLLMHEVLHLAFEHLAKSFGLNMDVANVAADLIVNQFIPMQYLPPHAITPDTLKIKDPKIEGKFVDIPYMKSFEFYYNLLSKYDMSQYQNKDKVKKKEKSEEESKDQPFDPFKNGQPKVMDCHDLWRKGSQSKEINSMAVKAVLDKAVDQIKHKHGEDDLTKKIMGELNKLYVKPQIRWGQKIKNFIGRKTLKQDDLTRTRPDRRLGLKAPGIKSVDGPDPFLMVDSSASMTDPMYEYAISEIISFCKNYADRINLGFFDTTVYPKVFKVTDKTKMPTRPKQGGTNFQCAVDFAINYKPSVLIIITDGEAEPLVRNPRFPVLWVLMEGKDKPSLGKHRIVVDFKEASKKK